MAEEKTTASEASTGIGIMAAVVCAFAGHAQGGWPTALAAAIAAFGGVKLLFWTVGWVWRFIVIGLVLLVALSILKNRYEWLATLFQ